jgi:hypothetical protein
MTTTIARFFVNVCQVTSPIPEDFEEEIVEELKKISILKAAVVYCGENDSDLNKYVTCVLYLLVVLVVYQYRPT